MKLVWNDLECAWVCSECGAIYGEEEVARMFGYNIQEAKNFTGGYCMDCGGQFDGIIVEEE